MDHVADDIVRLAALCGRRPSPPPRDWSALPADVLYLVMSRLSSLRLRLSLAAVCRSWHASVRLRLSYALPKLCLALPHERFFTFRRRSSGLKPHHSHPKSRHHGPYRGATSTQLLFATDSDDRGAYTLVNPFTGRERLLPLTPGIRLHKDDGPAAPEEYEGYWSEETPVRKLVVCPDGLVAAVLGHERSAKVAVCAPESAASSWSLGVHDPSRWYEDMVFFDGKLYALTHGEDLLAMEVGYDDASGAPRVLHVERAVDGGGGGRYTLQDYSRMRYLVVRPHGGGMLMVCRVMLEHGSTTYRFLLFQADLRSSRWVEVDTLGRDEALFVSRLCSRAVRADRHLVRGDQIFFLHDFAGMEGPPSGDALANVYDMKDGRVSELLPMQPLMDEAVPATWLFREDADAEE